jgi:hypothetical protein
VKIYFASDFALEKVCIGSHEPFRPDVKRPPNHLRRRKERALAGRRPALNARRHSAAEDEDNVEFVPATSCFILENLSNESQRWVAAIFRRGRAARRVGFACEANGSV